MQGQASLLDSTIGNQNLQLEGMKLSAVRGRWQDDQPAGRHSKRNGETWLLPDLAREK